MSFLAHQVINKPKSSSLKHLHESGIDTVSIPDEARLEGKGKEWSREEEWKEKEPEVNSSPNPTTKDKSRGTEEEFRQYAKELNLPENDGFFLLSKFQESNWTKNKGTEAIKDWKATMRVWKASRWLPSQKNITEKGRRGFQDEFKYKQNGHARRPHD
jgi:hypothetical protein